MLALPYDIDYIAPQSLALIGPSEVWPVGIEYLKQQLHPADFWQPLDLQKSLTVADVQSLLSFSSTTPVGGCKVAVLHDATHWRLDPANFLLKLLEEPPSYLHIVAFAESDQILPTVRSRLTVLYIEKSDGEGEKETGFRQWQRFFATLNMANQQERELAHEALYLQSMLHNGHNSDIVLEALRGQKG